MLLCYCYLLLLLPSSLIEIDAGLTMKTCIELHSSGIGICMIASTQIRHLCIQTLCTHLHLAEGHLPQLAMKQLEQKKNLNMLNLFLVILTRFFIIFFVYIRLKFCWSPLMMRKSGCRCIGVPKNVEDYLSGRGGGCQPYHPSKQLMCGQIAHYISS